MSLLRLHAGAALALTAALAGCSQVHDATRAPIAPAAVEHVVAAVGHRTQASRPTRPRTSSPKPVTRAASVPGSARVAHRAAYHHTTRQPPAAAADAYPYRTATSQTNDPWGFTKRQCVSYAAWRLARAGRAISNADSWGSALTWDDTARRLGLVVSSTPSVGSIAQWDAGESSSAYASGSSRPGGRFTAGGYGHVGYVTALYSDGSVQVAQYNLREDRTFSSLRMTAPRYLHLA